MNDYRSLVVNARHREEIARQQAIALFNKGWRLTHYPQSDDRRIYTLTFPSGFQTSWDYNTCMVHLEVVKVIVERTRIDLIGIDLLIMTMALLSYSDLGIPQDQDELAASA